MPSILSENTRQSREWKLPAASGVFGPKLGTGLALYVLNICTPVKGVEIAKRVKGFQAKTGYWACALCVKYSAPVL